MRTLTRISDELRRRRSYSAAELAVEPLIVLILDNFEGFRSEFETSSGAEVYEQFQRIYADGPESRIATVVSASRIGGVPSALASATSQKILFRLAEATEYGAVGLTRRQLPTFVPGRAVLSTSGQVVQVAAPLPSLSHCVKEVARQVASSPDAKGPAAVKNLPAEVRLSELVRPSVLSTDRWDLTVGLRDADFSAAGMVLYEGEHALVSGPSRSGKSTALLTIAAALRQAEPGAVVLGVACRRSPLQSNDILNQVATSTESIASVLDAALVASRPNLVLMDDVDVLDDPMGRIGQLLSMVRPDLHVIAAQERRSTEPVRPLEPEGPSLSSRPAPPAGARQGR